MAELNARSFWQTGQGCIAANVPNEPSDTYSDSQGFEMLRGP